jgi:hypothetical protein
MEGEDLRMFLRDGSEMNLNSILKMKGMKNSKVHENAGGIK